MARGEGDETERVTARRSVRPEAVERLACIALDRLTERGADADMSPEFLESFCTLLMAADYRAAERVLHAITRGRQDYAGIADGILSAAARHLGEKWQDDEVSFGDVSIAIAQVFRLNQAFGHRHAPWTRAPDRHLAIFATLPGQVHNLGIVLAAEAFRLEDWQVTLLLDIPRRDIVERVRRMRPETVGLSVNVNDRSHHVAQLIRELRALPLQFRLLLGGGAAPGLVVTLPRSWKVTVVTDIASALHNA